MQVPAQLEETIEDRVHAEEFEFTELQFIKSSRMSKRHLIFACRIRVSCPAVWPDLWPLHGWQCTCCVVLCAQLKSNLLLVQSNSLLLLVRDPTNWCQGLLAFGNTI